MLVLLYRGQLDLDARNPYFVACEQLRRRPVYASAQSDQHHSFRSVETYNTQKYVNILASHCCLAGLFEHYWVENIAYRLTRSTASIMLALLYLGAISNIYKVK